MTNRIQILRSSVSGNQPAASTRSPGELWVNFPDLQLGLIDASRNAQRLVAVRYFSASANYSANDFVVQSGAIYAANGAITAGAFNSSQWTKLVNATDATTLPYLPLAGGTVTGGTAFTAGIILADPTRLNLGGGTAGQVLTKGASASQVLWSNPGSTVSVGDSPPGSPRAGDLWWDSIGGQLYVWFVDASSSQWVVAVNVASPVAPSSIVPSMDGVASIGVDSGFSRGDHIHPSDTSRYAASNPSGFQTAAQVTATMNAGLAGKLNLTGGALTGQLTLNTTTVPGVYLQCGSGNPTMQISTGGSGSSWYFDVSQGNAYFSYGATWLRLQTDGSFAIASATAYKPSGTTWTVGSDDRIKTVLGDYDKGLSEVLALRPVEFVYNGNETFDADVNKQVDSAEPVPRATTAPYPASPHYQLALDQTVSVGFVAQEIEDIFPAMISRRAGYIDGEPVSDLRDMDTHELIFALVNAVRTLAARVEALELAR